ncbi:uncharacterized protein LOC131605140 [Vicia villosa]|uniref:uncharacterized protein LOC131605140 n=1 Tax=Vicia villosa TaxID=3911 RepID=UPI00273AC3FA|nr:uncharacterized protein LOC131605140 [Vicia villosa]
MSDDETIQQYHMKILEIANGSSALGEKMSEEKLVRKILWSLPRKFYMKVIAIEEDHEITTMRVIELVGSLQTFELAVNDKSEKKNKGMTFVSSTKDEIGQDDLDTEEGLSKTVVLLGKQFNKIMKIMDRRGRPDVKNISSDIRNNNNSHNDTRSEKKVTLKKRLFGYQDQTQQVKFDHDTSNRKHSGIDKNVALITHTSLRMPTEEDWYLDSGCSNHMTGRKNSLVDLKLEGNNYVTLGDGDIREVKGVEKTEVVGIPNLNNVLLVQGLAANLISINQLCDEGFNARFTKDKCIITNEENEGVMKGFRSKDNC